MVLYECKLCKYTTTLKSNYNRHNNSGKHNEKVKLHETTTPDEGMLADVSPMLAEVSPKLAEVSPKLAKVSPKLADDDNIYCKYCDKQFKHRSSLSKHIKYSCKKNKDEDLKELVRLLNLQLEQQRTYVEKKDKQLDIQHKQIDNQQKQIDKLMEKLQVPHVSNTTNNIQNNIRLSYQNTDMSRITDADYRKSINCLLMCVKTFIGIVHLNPEHPENMNIYISNLKDKYIMVYSGDTWELRNREYEMDNLYDNNEMLLTEWVEEHGNEELQNKFKNYLERKEQHIDMIREEIRLMLYNKRHLTLGE